MHELDETPSPAAMAMPPVVIRPASRPFWFYLLAGAGCLGGVALAIGGSDAPATTAVVLRPLLDRLLAGGFLTQGGVVVACALAGLAPKYLFDRWFQRLTIDGSGVTHHYGLLVCSRVFLPYRTIESIEIERYPLGRRAMAEVGG